MFLADSKIIGIYYVRSICYDEVQAVNHVREPTKRSDEFENKQAAAAAACVSMIIGNKWRA